MATATDLMGLGMDAESGKALGNTPSAITATGTTQATAAAAKTTLIEIAVATNADGIVLPADANIGTAYWVFNSSAFTALVYVPSGHKLNTVSDDKVTLLTHKGVVFWKYNRTNWSSILTA